jgi:PTH2 family peptidyl-tRNA hydrolase
MTVEKDLYDDEALAKMRLEQEDPWVQYIIINKDLEMGCGKIAAQVGHGCGMHILKYKEISNLAIAHLIGDDRKIKIKNTLHWIEESFRKITKVAHKKEFDKIKELTEVDCFMVKDAGLTEIEPGSETVLVCWPIKRSQCPKIIHKLQNLK